ncbi:unnamed protein product [Closterium sp. Naga37s-1]|nr:unnamed protein product [Closterium sp. Naga37s-1]
MASRGGSKPGRESKGEKGNKDLAVTAAAIDAAMETPLLAEEEEDELEMAKAWKAVEAVRVSADLPAAAKQLITLLRRVDQNGRLYAGPAVKDAIRRYEQCWLRMAYGQTDDVMRTLQPPLDVQWVWLVHRLNPVRVSCSSLLPFLCHQITCSLLAATTAGRAVGVARAPPQPRTCLLLLPPSFLVPPNHMLFARCNHCWTCSGCGLCTASTPYVSPAPPSFLSCATKSHALCSLQPLLDVQWVWLVHRLNPVRVSCSSLLPFLCHQITCSLLAATTAGRAVGVACAPPQPRTCLLLLPPSFLVPPNHMLFARCNHCWTCSGCGSCTASTRYVLRAPRSPRAFSRSASLSRLFPPPRFYMPLAGKASVHPPSLHAPSTPPALLSQEAYAEDCSTILGRLLDGAIFDPDDDDVGSESARGEAAATAACRALWEELFPLEPYDPPALAAPAVAAPAAGDDDVAGAAGAGEERDEGSGAAEGDGAAATADDAAAAAGDGGGDGAERQGNGAAAAPDAAAAAVVPPALPPSLPSELTYDLEAAIARQSSFFYQVDRPWMLERQYLQGSLQRYRMFLNLVMLNRGAFLTPTYDIDLLWHAHMMCVAAYTKDSDWLLSRLLGHDDSDAMPVAAATAAASSTSNTIDSNTRKRLEWAYRATAQLWDRTYGSPFDRAGAMFRGPAPVPIPPPPLVAPRRVLPLEGGEGEFTVAELNAGRGLEPRMTVEVDFMVWGLLNFHPDKPENLFLMIRTKRAAHDFSLRTRSLPARPGCRPPAWRQRWALEAEVATGGLQFELRAESGTFWGGLWGPRLVGSGGITWEEVLSRPALLVDRQVALAPVDLLTAVGIRGEADGGAGGTGGGGGNKAAGGSGGADGSGGGGGTGGGAGALVVSGGGGKASELPRVHVAVSLTPPTAAPYLLRTVFMRGTDDNGSMICEEIAVQRDFRPQVGEGARWVGEVWVRAHVSTGDGDCARDNHEDKEAALFLLSTLVFWFSHLPPLHPFSPISTGGGGCAWGTTTRTRSALPYTSSLSPISCSLTFLRPHPFFPHQYGRWGSRTVYNHEDKEVFVIRKRVAKGTWHARYRPIPVEPKEKVILLHQGGWRYIETDPVPLPEPEPPHLRVGVVRGPVVAQAVPQASDDYDQIQRFCLLDCLPNGRTATVTIERRRDATIFIQGIQLTLEEEGNSRVLLLPGRHHKYKVPGAPSVEDLGFATLIRFPPDAPHGRATALLNWKGAAMEVAPDESVPLVLLLCTCLSEAINDMAGINRVRRFRRLPLADPDPANHWGALSISRDTVGGAAAAAAAKNGEEEFSFSSVEMSRQKWWNRRPLRFAVGAGSCGAGACGPSCTGPVDIFSG